MGAQPLARHPLGTVRGLNAEGLRNRQNEQKGVYRNIILAATNKQFRIDARSARKQ
jgi:hypothetical protein